MTNGLSGRFDAAKACYQQALTIRHHCYGDNHPSYADSLNDLALLYVTMGSYATAEPLYRQAMTIYRTTLGEAHYRFAISLNNLAALSEAKGDWSAAESYYRAACQSLRQTLGARHPDYASSLDNLAGLQFVLNKFDEAELGYKEALAIRRRVLGEHHPDVAQSWNNLGLLHLAQGDYAAAEPCYQHALSMRRHCLGANHPAVAQSLNNLAGLCAATGRATEALAFMQQAAMMDDQMIGQLFALGSESQRLAYLSQLQGRLSAFLSLLTEHFHHHPDIVRAGFDLVLRRKALGIEALAIQREAIVGGHYPDLQPKLAELRRRRAQIAQALLAGAKSDDPASDPSRLADWQNHKEHLEVELAQQIKEMKLERVLREVNLATIVEALPEETALVEWIRFDRCNFNAVRARGEPQWSEPGYLAFVLRAGALETVQMWDLGAASQIDQLIADFRTVLTGEEDLHPGQSYCYDPGISLRSDLSSLRSLLTRADRHLGSEPHSPKRSEKGTELGMALRRQVFDPLLSALGERTRLFLSPDGDLARLPFEVLPWDKDHYLINSYRISYLSVSRDVLRFSAAQTGQSTQPIVIADPDFDLGGAAVPNFVADTPFNRLKGTYQEGKQVANLVGVAPVLRKSALKATLKKCCSPPILHIATHGFFLPNAPSNFSGEVFAPIKPDLQANRLRQLASLQNPLLRSALVLAGANSWFQEGRLSPKTDNGLLTAEDVASLDLLATDLVVLSACQTGLGAVQVGEGVFGLRRAFIIAGAKTLVMSLWKVPDPQTQELMIDFYPRLLAGEPKANALRQAQLNLKEKYPDPFYWGAFICQGNPGPLVTM